MLSGAVLLSQLKVALEPKSVLTRSGTLRPFLSSLPNQQTGMQVDNKCELVNEIVKVTEQYLARALNFTYILCKRLFCRASTLI